MNRILLILLLFFSVSCRNDPIGTPCVRKGDGFTASHNCKTKCLSIWKITCPDGSKGNSKVCAGNEGCERHGCSKGEVCYQTNFDRAYCIPESICPGWRDPNNHPQVEVKSLKSTKPSSLVTKPAERIAAPNE